MGWGEDRRTLEAKAATITVFVKAPGPISNSQSALRVITSLAMTDIILLLLFTEGATVAMLRLLGSFFLEVIIHSRPGAIWSFQSP